MSFEMSLGLQLRELELIRADVSSLVAEVYTLVVFAAYWCDAVFYPSYLASEEEISISTAPLLSLRGDS